MKDPVLHIYVGNIHIASEELHYNGNCTAVDRKHYQERRTLELMQLHLAEIKEAKQFVTSFVVVESKMNDLLFELK